MSECFRSGALRLASVMMAVLVVLAHPAIIGSVSAAGDGEFTIDVEHENGDQADEVNSVIIYQRGEGKVKEVGGPGPGNEVNLKHTFSDLSTGNEYKVTAYIQDQFVGETDWIPITQDTFYTPNDESSVSRTLTAESPVEVTVRAYHEDGSTPLADAEMTIESHEPGDWREGTTGENGYARTSANNTDFSLYPTNEGNYTIKISDGGEQVASKQMNTLDGDRDIEITTDVPVYELDVDTEDGGTVELSSSGATRSVDREYPGGAKVELTANPDSDRQFAGWEGEIGNVSDDNDSIVVRMNKSREIMATFAKETHEIQLNAQAVPDSEQQSHINIINDVTTVPDKTLIFSISQSVQVESVIVAYGKKGGSLLGYNNRISVEGQNNNQEYSVEIEDVTGIGEVKYEIRVKTSNDIISKEGSVLVAPEYTSNDKLIGIATEQPRRQESNAKIKKFLLDQGVGELADIATRQAIAKVSQKVGVTVGSKTSVLAGRLAGFGAGLLFSIPNANPPTTVDAFGYNATDSVPASSNQVLTVHEDQGMGVGFAIRQGVTVWDRLKIVVRPAGSSAIAEQKIVRSYERNLPDGNVHVITSPLQFNSIASLEPGTSKLYEVDVRLISPETDYASSSVVASDRITVRVNGTESPPPSISQFLAPSGEFSSQETIQSDLTVTNTADKLRTVFVGYSARGPNGTIYDNGGTTGKPVTLAPDESRTVDVSLKIQSAGAESATPSSGQYDLIAAVWKGSNRENLDEKLNQRVLQDQITVSTPLDDELPSPSLSAPRGVVDSTQEVTLQWSDVESGSGSEDDVTYDVYLGTGTDNPRTIVSEDISGTQTTVSVDPGGSYSWKVIAHRGQQQSSSTVGSFSVSSKDISADEFSPVQPTNGRQDTGFGVTLKWNAPEPDRYANNYVYLDTDPTTQDGELIHDSRRKSTEIDNLDPDTTYYWQVVVVNNGKRTAGPVWSFSTAPKTGSLTLSGVRLEEDEELVIDGEAGNDHTSRTRLSYYVTAEEIRSESGGEYDIRVIDQQTGVVLGTDESNTDDEGDRREVELELHDESLFKTPGERQLKLIAKHHASGDEVTTTTSVNVELESPEDQATILPERPTVEDEVTIDISEMSEIGSQIVLNPDEYRWLVSHDETDNVKVDTNGQEEVSFQPEDETEDLFEEYRYALKDTEEVRNPYIVEDDVFVVDENTYEPDMEVGDLSVSKNVVEGTPVEASIKLTNDGRAKANYIIRWKVDGQIVDSAADSVIRRDDEDDDLQEDTENEQFSLRPGDHQITAVVIDARGEKHKRTQSVTVAENNAPSLSSPSPAPGESLSNSDQTLSWEATDANGDDLRYNVSLDAGDSTPDKRVATNINTQSIDPRTLNDGTTYYWQVTATDEHGRTNTGPVWSFSTSDEDDAPVSPPDELTASAGPDQTVTAGKTVELDASGSTAPDNSALTYEFQQVSRSGSSPDVSLQDPETRTPEFTAPDVDSETTVTFELTVTNSAGTTTTDTDTDTDRVNITVKPSDPTSDQPLYTAGFESTPSGETPSDWTASGNSAIRVSNAQAADGTKSLRLSGSSGGCWETVGFGNLGQNGLFTQSTAGSVSFSDRFDDGTLNSQWEGAGIDDPQVTESDGTLSHAVGFKYNSDNNRLQTTQTFDATGTHRIEMRVRTTQSDYWGYGVQLDGTNGSVSLKEHKWERFNRFAVYGVTDRPDKYSSDYKYYGEQTHKAKLADATSETSFITYSLTVNFDTQTVTEVRRGSETWETDLQIKDIGDSYQLQIADAGHDIEYDAIAVGPADGDWSLFNDAADEQMPTPTSASSSQSMNISFSVRPGGQAQTGCHDHNTAVNLNTGNDGTYGGKNIKLIEFTPDGSVEATFGENTPLGSYDVGTWTDVRVKYTPLKEGQARVAYFIDGEQREIITRGEPSFADQLSYLQVNTGEYTTYVDDINLTTASSGVGDGDVDNPLPTTSLRFTDQTISSGSATLSVDTAQFGNQTVPGEKFVVVVHKTTESTYDDEIGPKVGESDVLSPGTQQSVEVDLSRTLGPSDDIAELTKSQSLVAMLHRADTDDGDNINHGSHITRNGDKVTSRAQVTVSSPPDKPGPGAAWTIPVEYPRLSVVSADIDSDDREELGVGNYDGYGPARYGVIQQGNWIWNTTSSAVVNAKTTADTDGDGSPEILFGARASSTWVRSYGSAPASRWSVTHGDWVDGSQRADTDGDGQDEVAVVSGNRGDLTVIDDGRVQWQPQSPANIEGLFGLTEVTGDDTPEILTHSPPNDDKQGLQLITKSDTGGVEVVWRAEPNAPVRATLSELDSDTDASEEVIAAYPGRGLITSLDAETGEMRWREQVEVASADRVRFADVTGDETPEVLLWSDTTLRVFSADSRSLIELSTSAPILRATGSGSGSGDGTLLLLTEDALISRTAEEELTRIQIDGTQINEMSVGDTDGDNNPEVALGTDGSLRLYDNLEMASSQLEFPSDERPPASVTFTDQTLPNGSSTVTVDTAQFGNQTVPGEKFVVVVHKTTESTYDDGIGPKVGESDVLSPGTQQSVEVDLSRTLGPSDDIDTVSNSQSLVAMLHRADTDDDEINHGPHITRNGDTVTSRAQVTVSPPPGDLVADAGPDQTVTAGKTVELDASGSTAPDESALTYAFQQVSQPDSLPDVSLQDPETQTPEFTAPDVDSETTLTFELTITQTDSTGTTTDTDTDTDTDQVNITITPADDPLPTTSLRFTDQTLPNGSSTVTVDTAQFGNESVPGEKFVVVVHKTTESIYDDEIGPKVGESDVLSPGTRQSVEVDLSQTLAPSDDMAELTESQSLVAMLHRADTTDGDGITHGAHITRDGDKVTSRAQLTVSSSSAPAPTPALRTHRNLTSTKVTNGSTVTVTVTGSFNSPTDDAKLVDIISGGEISAENLTITDAAGAAFPVTTSTPTPTVDITWNGTLGTVSEAKSFTVKYEVQIPADTPVGTIITFDGTVTDSTSGETTGIDGDSSIEVVATTSPDTDTDTDTDTVTVGGQEVPTEFTSETNNGDRTVTADNAVEAINTFIAGDVSADVAVDVINAFIAS